MEEKEIGSDLGLVFGFGGAAVPAAWGCRALSGIRHGRAPQSVLAWARPEGWAGDGVGQVGRPRLDPDASDGRQEDRFPRSTHWYGTTFRESLVLAREKKIPGSICPWMAKMWRGSTTCFFIIKLYYNTILDILVLPRCIQVFVADDLSAYE
jgi:hypothetical protein